ncbi:TetR/AcrR family transcriptional regulator [Pseudomonas migulae]|uniref:DNA-binding transcriptional regulator, AcrR family n=1 Tax=Pseudomonas migulae TaxID=78543 RepID=A0A1H5IKH0_9PSED|nr:TetR/AcrR family transcriptional regulator [Pseudomonas migulae]SEE40665.1 DNA-binding transcriptional regulator, AcrR family [Pseudomonas migulae]
MSKVEEVKRQAVRLMAVKGFEAMSLRQLAAALGVRPGSVYSHYESKGQLLLDVHCEFLEDLLSTWLEQRQKHFDSVRMLQRFVSVYVSFHYAKRAESRIVQLDFRSLDEAGRVQVGELRAQYDAELKMILQTGEQQGVFQFADLHDTHLALFCVMQGVCASETPEARALEVCLSSISRLVGIPPQSRSRLHGELRVTGRIAAAIKAAIPQEQKQQG